MIAQHRKYADLAGFDERLRWVAVVTLAVLVSGLEAVGALLVYLLLGIVTGVEGALELPLLGDVTARLPVVEHETLLLGTAGLVAAFFVGRAIAVLCKEYVSSRVVENAGARLSARLARGYLAMPYSFHLQRNSAELIRNAYSTVQTLVQEVFRPLVKIVSEALVVVAILAVLLASAPLATALVLAALAPAAAVLLRLVYPRLRALGGESQRVSRSSLQSLQQSLEGMRDIKVLGREAFFDTEFRRTRDQLARVRYLRDVLRDVPGVGLETLIVVVIAGLFAAAVLLEGAAVGAIPLLGLFGYAALRLKPSLTVIAKSVNSLRFAQAGIDDIHADLIMLKHASVDLDREPAEPLPFRREIVLDGVTFRYEGAHVDALRDVDLRIARGESIGIVGPTGGGKTTLVDVILGLLEPTQGRVLVDGLDIRGRTAAWQRNLGVVPQSLFLVDDTLRRNIALGLEENDVDEERVGRAVDLAQLRPVVDALPDGLDTVVGERGVRLSGGQRQRVAIARALYRQPEVLVFDEGTSALDTVTEAQLLEALDGLREDHTIITVAHRLSTVRDCDRVVLVEDGRLVDIAPYEELVARNERFRQMAP